MFEKLGINIIATFARIIKRNPKALDYLLSVYLKDELIRLSEQPASIINPLSKNMEHSLALCRLLKLDGIGIIVDIDGALGSTG